MCGRKQYGEILLDDGPEFLSILEAVKSLPQGRPRDCSPIDLRALVCCEHDSSLLFRHPIGVDVNAPYFQQKFGHIPKEGVFAVIYLSKRSQGNISNCCSPVLSRLSFLRTMESVNVSMFSLDAISIAFGCGGASTTLMKPCRLGSVSQFRRSVVMIVGISG